MAVIFEFCAIFKTLLSLLYSLYIYPGLSCGSDMDRFFRLLHNEYCVCSGQEVVYECIIDSAGTVATVWSGTAFSCPGTGNQISLRHHEFENGSAVGVCNDGAIVARGTIRANNSYISQLTITIDTSMNGSTVQCAADDGRTNHIVGNHTIGITASSELGDPEPPQSLQITNVSNGVLIFSWSHDIVNRTYCLPIEQDSNIIDIVNCGVCNIGTSNIAECTNVTADGGVCLFTVYAKKICGDALTERDNKSILVYLKVPDNPIIRDAQCYCNVKIINFRINQSEPFNISDGIDGSVISYNLTYFDSVLSHWIRSSTTSFSCDDRVCITHIKIPSCPMSSGSISMSLFASNLLGTSEPSNYTVICKAVNDKLAENTTQLVAIIITICLLLIISVEIFVIIVVSSVVLKRI